MDILIKNIELKGSLLLTPKAIFKPVEEYDHEKIVQKWEIVKEAEIVPVPEHGDLIDRDKEIKEWELTKCILSECEQKNTFDYRKACVIISALSQAEVVLERTT